MISLAVAGEDRLCCTLAQTLAAQLSDRQVRIELNRCAKGFGEFKAWIPQMNTVARTSMPVLMLADGDQGPCVVEQIKAWKPPQPSARLVLRLAVKESEAWLLADADAFSAFAEVSTASVPREPEALANPKQSLLDLIKRGKNRQLKDEMLPGKGSRMPFGLGYHLHLNDFIHNHWSAARAAERAPSLRRALPRIQALLAAHPA